MTNPAQTSFGIHWFRRDLRVAGNNALLHNWQKNKGRVVGVFCFDSQFLRRADFSHNRFAFFLNTLQSLQSELRAIGSDLLIVDERPDPAFRKISDYFKHHKKWNLSQVTYNRDYEPFARNRDRAIEDLLSKLNVPCDSFRDHLMIEPLELDKGKMGEYYQIYSPFAKKWFELFHSPTMQARIEEQKRGLRYLFEKKHKENLFCLSWSDLTNAQFPYQDALKQFQTENGKKVTVEIPEAGSIAVRHHLETFKSKLENYKEARDIPSQAGTSKFSLFLKNGSLTTTQIMAYYNLQKLTFKDEQGPGRFLKELVWREFYYHILYHYPLVETEAFIKKYKKIRWQNNEILFKQWCEGKTGFPIVDAGMRELNTTGWMHNRVRMIVSSFLTKDLLIDWRWGEKYFMEKLLDGDLAPNNGGWQWAASTGCDPQPYFRIFNPWLQAKKFDPEGEYIRQFVEELKDVDTKTIHDEEADRTAYGYPKPIVQHKMQKEKALKMYDVE
ncbi:MAG: deoxyribodipyrimidine photo-lyase [Bdellovibrionaceae bacterium]|nr:deoxyribodipyrimidine photo-lyase [Pseudobdellovibrionaceae bacterium]